MFVQINPKWNVNYRAGQIYCCYKIGHPVSMGISYFSYKSGGTPEFEKVSHVGVCVDSISGISAQPHGIDYEDLNKIFCDPKKRIFFIEPVLLDTLGHKPLTEGMKKRIGEKYDWKLITGFWIVNSWLGSKLSDNFKAKILKTFNIENRSVCSEVIADELYKNGYCSDSNKFKTPRQIIECNCIKPWKRILNEKKV